MAGQSSAVEREDSIQVREDMPFTDGSCPHIEETLLAAGLRSV